MRNFVFIIGSMDDFENFEEFNNCYADGTLHERNASTFDIQLHECCATEDFTVAELATILGHGLAFENDWCADGTFSNLIEVK